LFFSSVAINAKRVSYKNASSTFVVSFADTSKNKLFLEFSSKNIWPALTSTYLLLF
jgi:hypothetical protein